METKRPHRHEETEARTPERVAKCAVLVFSDFQKSRRRSGTKLSRIKFYGTIYFFPLIGKKHKNYFQYVINRIFLTPVKKSHISAFVTAMRTVCEKGSSESTNYPRRAKRETIERERGEQRARNWSVQCVPLIDVEFRPEASSSRFDEKYAAA